MYVLITIFVFQNQNICKIEANLMFGKSVIDSFIPKK